MDQARIALIGAGAIGRAWALVFARAGFPVRLWDPDPRACEHAVRFVRAQLADLAAFGLFESAADSVTDRITIAASVADAVRDADLVQENGPENLAVRRQVFADLDALAAPRAILASSTSGMPASSFTAALAGRARCLVAHPANPPHLLPLVELAPAPWTDPDVVDRIRALMVSAGRQVALLRREVDGFVMNRLQGALLAEAFRLVADGVVGPDDVDTVVKHSLGLRWSFMGPFETVDLNAPGGISDFCARYGSLYEALQEQMPPRRWDADLVAEVAAARRTDVEVTAIPERQAWRDRRLMALAAHLAGQPRP